MFASLPMAGGLGRDLARGITRFAHISDEWELILVDTQPDDFPDVPAYVDGIIAATWRSQIRPEYIALGKPLVFALSGQADDGIPRVIDDWPATGRLAYAHLAGLGHEHFALVCGRDERRHTHSRFAAFREAMQPGHACHEPAFVCRDFYPENQPATARRLGAWLAERPRPLAVFCSGNEQGRCVLEACRQAGLMVPEQVAVLAPDNDDLAAEAMTPPLSGIDMGWQHAGHLAAELLQRLFDGEDLRGHVERVSPVGVVPRRSTDTLAIGDADVAAAVSVVRERACEEASLDEILADIPASRRKLEMGFRRWLGRTINQERTRARIQRAQQLLGLCRNKTVIEVAVRTGFRSRSRFFQAFRRETGLTPSQFRQRRA